MANANGLALTDDEAAAVAVHANGAWRTPLPTVDESDEADPGPRHPARPAFTCNP